MTRILLLAATTVGLNACAMTAVAVGCGSSSGGCPAEVVDLAWHVDGKVFGAVFGSPGSPERVSVQGVVTSDGIPLHQARVDLSVHREIWTTWTDRRGRYRIHGVVERGMCSDLHLTIQYSDQRKPVRLPVECSEQRLDYDATSSPTD
jgi:hypothetical protein